MATAPEDVTAEIGGYLDSQRRMGYDERLSVHVAYGDLEDWQAATAALLAQRDALLAALVREVRAPINVPTRDDWDDWGLVRYLRDRYGLRVTLGDDDRRDAARGGR